MTTSTSAIHTINNQGLFIWAIALKPKQSPCCGSARGCAVRKDASVSYRSMEKLLEPVLIVGRSEHGSGSALKNVSDTSINAGQTDYKWYCKVGTEDFLANNPPAPVLEGEVA